MHNNWPVTLHLNRRAAHHLVSQKPSRIARVLSRGIAHRASGVSLLNTRRSNVPDSAQTFADWNGLSVDTRHTARLKIPQRAAALAMRLITRVARLLAPWDAAAHDRAVAAGAADAAPSLRRWWNVVPLPWFSNAHAEAAYTDYMVNETSCGSVIVNLVTGLMMALYLADDAQDPDETQRKLRVALRSASLAALTLGFVAYLFVRHLRLASFFLWVRFCVLLSTSSLIHARVFVEPIFQTYVRSVSLWSVTFKAAIICVDVGFMRTGTLLCLDTLATFLCEHFRPSAVNGELPVRWELCVLLWFLGIVFVGDIQFRQSFTLKCSLYLSRVTAEEANRLHKFLTDSMLDMVCVHEYGEGANDGHTGGAASQLGRVRYVSQSCLRLTGWNRADLLNKSMLEFLHDGDQALAAAIYSSRSDPVSERTHGTLADEVSAINTQLSGGRAFTPNGTGIGSSTGRLRSRWGVEVGPAGMDRSLASASETHTSRDAAKALLSSPLGSSRESSMHLSDELAVWGEDLQAAIRSRLAADANPQSHKVQALPLMDGTFSPSQATLSGSGVGPGASAATSGVSWLSASMHTAVPSLVPGGMEMQRHMQSHRVSAHVRGSGQANGTEPPPSTRSIAATSSVVDARAATTSARDAIGIIIQPRPPLHGSELTYNPIAHVETSRASEGMPPVAGASLSASASSGTTCGTATTPVATNRPPRSPTSRHPHHSESGITLLPGVRHGALGAAAAINEPLHQVAEAVAAPPLEEGEGGPIDCDGVDVRIRQIRRYSSISPRHSEGVSRTPVPPSATATLDRRLSPRPAFGSLVGDTLNDGLLLGPPNHHNAAAAAPDMHCNSGMGMPSPTVTRLLPYTTATPPTNTGNSHSHSVNMSSGHLATSHVHQESANPLSTLSRLQLAPHLSSHFQDTDSERETPSPIARFRVRFRRRSGNYSLLDVTRNVTKQGLVCVYRQV